jgi:hypothetical protein
MTTLTDFIRDNHVRLTAERTDHNPHMDDDARNMDHWKCKLIVGPRSMTVYFSKGFAHNGAEPTAPEVLDCLASDASSVVDASFEDWCSEYGYDTDSRKAEQTYKTIRRQARRLRDLFSSDAFKTLLWDTERL